MAIPKPNVQIELTKRWRFRVHVGGVPMSGVTGVEVRAPIREYKGPDGWSRVERSGPPSFFIEIPARFVNIGTEPEDGQTASD